VGDLLGFSNLMMNLRPEIQSIRVDEWISLAKTAAQEAAIEKFQLISDTIFASTEPTPEGLANLVKFSRLLLEEGTKVALPIRGAIAHGDVSWEREVTFGKALVDAYRLANNQNWIGVSVAESVAGHHLCWGWSSLVNYPTPMKSGPILIRPVVAWTIPPFLDFVKGLTSQGLSREGETLEWEWGSKVQNTALFGIYLRLLTPHGRYLNPVQFQGILPVQMLDQMTTGQVFMQLTGGENKLVRLTIGCPPTSQCASADLPPLSQYNSSPAGPQA